ncbi:MAG TPA: AAA family ATPase [Phycisphaerae bacterium]|nr:AAA family ATPase [Phycisphaerae bacterium]
MLTQLRIRNFKRFTEATIDLGKSVVFIGPNNSGKTTALQALALWDIGLRSWLAKRGGKDSPEKRPGVAVNRKELNSIPIPAANLLWHNLRTRKTRKVSNEKGEPATRTSNIRVDVIAAGITSDVPWECGFEFDYANEESFICRPVRLKGSENKPVSQSRFSEIPDEAKAVRVAYLPPMSGLAEQEHLKQAGEVAFLIGQGRTAEVLRNVCYQVYQNNKAAWEEMVQKLESLFGVALRSPSYITERSEIVMDYDEPGGARLDLSSAGRGLQQTVLLLAHLYANPKTTLLLDEPDAHLEILRQRQTYQLLTDVADKQGSQIVAASHSEVVLNEAAGQGKVIAFVGKPHTMNDRPSQVMKSLTDIGWDLYYQAEERGWVLFLEGSTDLAILKAFARTLNHDAKFLLESPFVHYVSTNLPKKARDVFYGLKEAKPDLLGAAIFDRVPHDLQSNDDLVEMMWSRREIENYFCTRDVLLAFARGTGEQDLFGEAERSKREDAMRDAISEVSRALATLNKPDPWGPDVKATDEFLDPLFKRFFEKLQLPITLRKADYHQLASLVPAAQVSPEIVEKLNRLLTQASRAKPKP